MKTFVLIVLATLTAVAVAENTERNGTDQEKDQRTAQQVSQYATTSCQSTFTSGTGNSYLSFCVTENGNVSTLESPKTFNQIYLGAEGYGICDVTNGNSETFPRYYDWGRYGDSASWLSSSITQPHGPNTFPLTITRSTSDGGITLIQTFSQNKTTPSVKISMTLKNNSAIPRDLWLVRFVDIDADGTSAGDYFDYNQYSSWGTQFGAFGHGLMMHAGASPLLSQGNIVAAGAQDPCGPNIQQTPYSGDGAAWHQWYFAPLAAQSSQKLTIEYRPF
jgi:hypothetical protein